MSIIGNNSSEYNSCIANATPENINVFIEQYELAEQKENINKQNQTNSNISNKFTVSNYNKNFNNYPENLMQCEGAWANYPIACAQNRKDGTVCTSGCGYVAYTMVVRSFGYNNVTPDLIVDIACNDVRHNNSAASGELLTNKILNDKFGLNAKRVSTVNEANNELKNGSSLIVLMPGHWISVLGINPDGTVIVGDSYFPFASTNKYTLQSLYDVTSKYREPYGWRLIIAYSKK